MFWFTLNPAPAESVATIRATRRDAVAQHAMPDRLRGEVLVVDDDSHVRNAWIALMEAWGVRVSCAADGVEA
ncbi:hypothetical protein ABTE85_23295, partial [Acinetobacter baumannii]